MTWLEEALGIILDAFAAVNVEAVPVVLPREVARPVARDGEAVAIVLRRSLYSYKGPGRALVSDPEYRLNRSILLASLSSLVARSAGRSEIERTAALKVVESIQLSLQKMPKDMFPHDNDDSPDPDCPDCN